MKSEIKLLAILLVLLALVWGAVFVEFVQDLNAGIPLDVLLIEWTKSFIRLVSTGEIG